MSTPPDAVRPSDAARPPTPTGRPLTDWPAELPYHGWKMWFVRVGGVLVIVLLALLVGVWLGGARARLGGAAAEAVVSGGNAAPTEWTCSMHPQIRLPNRGQCPICFMDLVPVRTGSDDAGAPRVTLSPRARLLAQVETAPVEYRELTHAVRLVGKVAADETRIRYVSSYFPGRLDRLFVNYGGILVRPGDHLAEIYSPELLVAQREFLLALEGVEAARADHAEGPRSGERAATLLEAARRKLELWGIPADEVERLTRERRPSDRMRIDAPFHGWVLERQGYEGMYVETGTRLFTLVDLRAVWVLLDAYELDLPFLRYGQTVEFETEAYPGRRISGRIAYIDPTFTEPTRTVKVRVNVPNENLQLRPGMFVRALAAVRLGADGQVIEPALAGKWISPMHPEVVKDGPGQCDVCGMDLVPAEALGFAGQEAAPAQVLAIPQTAVLWTGRRALVYVATDREGESVYEGRVIELGPRAGEFYVVRGGLKPGERVVTRGAIQVDAAVQIQGRPSMMQPPPAAALEPVPPPVVSRAVAGAAYHRHFRPVIERYLDLAAALAADDGEQAGAAVRGLRPALEQARPEGLEGNDADLFRKLVEEIRAALPAAEKPTLEELRAGLPRLTAAVETYLRTFGHDRPRPLARAWCPMAFDNRGAAWLQAEEEIANPYFGARMLRCGEFRGTLGPDGKEGD